MTAPVIIDHDGVHVVRDDLYPGGTKARYIAKLYETADEIVYASPAEGGTQTALAVCAQQAGKRATLFIAKRAVPHPRAIMAKALGAKVFQVAPGYLNVVQARAASYAKEAGATLAPFGMDMPEAIQVIADAARSIGADPDEVWCASGSGVLMRGLALAWPNARRHSVQVGRSLSESDVAGATVHVYNAPFAKAASTSPPFPSDPHYDAKAWEVCSVKRGAGRVLFWNVTGPAEPQ